MIGEIGALGGSFIPNAMGISKQTSGSFSYGFLSFALLALIAFLVLRLAQRKWVTKWVDKGGKAKIVNEEIEFEIQHHVPGIVPVKAEGKTSSLAYRHIIYPVVFILRGRMLIGLPDGSVRGFGPGEHFHSADLLPAGDTFDPARHGHWSAQDGPEPLVTLFVRG